MAKLKARGRQEIFRIEKIKEVPRQGFAERYRVQKALMSDGNVLEKVDDGTWKVIGKVKPGLSAEAALKIYADRGWRLLMANPSYFNVSGDTVTGKSSEPLRTEKEAERSKKSRAAGAERRKKQAEEEEKRSGPGLYITNRSTSSLRLVAEIGPLADMDTAVKAARKRAREFHSGRLTYLLPVRVIESKSRWDAERNIGKVIWNSTPSSDDDEEPGFYIVPHRYLDEAAGPYDTFEQAEDAAWEYLRSRDDQKLQEECAAEWVPCPPTRIIESRNSTQALQGKGYVWWIDGLRKGPPVDPRQSSFTNGF
jgi:hypothetical protein